MPLTGDAARGAIARRAILIPMGLDNANVIVDGGETQLANLQKVFWPQLGITKRDLLQYYLDVSPWPPICAIARW